MTATDAAPNVHCRIIGGDKLPSQTGGSKAICAAIERAVASRAANVRYEAEVNVVSASKLTAALVVNGRALPAQNFAVMDRNLNATSIQHFADAVAAAIAEAAKK